MVPPNPENGIEFVMKYNGVRGYLKGPCQCVPLRNYAMGQTFNKGHLFTEDRNKEFDFYEVDWPFPIDKTRFALEAIDF